MTSAQVAGQAVVAPPAAQRPHPTGMRHLEYDAVVVCQPPDQPEVQHNPPGCVLLARHHSDNLLQTPGGRGVRPCPAQCAGRSFKGSSCATPHLGQFAGGLQTKPQSFFGLWASYFAQQPLDYFFRPALAKLVQGIGAQHAQQHVASIIVVEAMHRLAQVIIVGSMAPDDMEPLRIVHQLGNRCRAIAKQRHALNHEGAGAFRQSQRIQQAVKDVEVSELQRPLPQAGYGKGRNRQTQQLHIRRYAVSPHKLATYLGELTAVAGPVGYRPRGGPVKPEHRATILPAGRKLDFRGVLQVVPHGRSGEFRAQTDHPATGVGEAE